MNNVRIFKIALGLFVVAYSTKVTASVFSPGERGIVISMLNIVGDPAQRLTALKALLPSHDAAAAWRTIVKNEDNFGTVLKKKLGKAAMTETEFQAMWASAGAPVAGGGVTIDSAALTAALKDTSKDFAAAIEAANKAKDEAGRKAELKKAFRALFDKDGSGLKALQALGIADAKTAAATIQGVAK